MLVIRVGYGSEKLVDQFQLGAALTLESALIRPDRLRVEINGQYGTGRLLWTHPFDLEEVFELLALLD